MALVFGTLNDKQDRPEGRALCQAGAAFPAEEEWPRMSNDFTGVLLLTASFLHYDLDREEIICRAWKRKGTA